MNDSSTYCPFGLDPKDPDFLTTLMEILLEKELIQIPTLSAAEQWYQQALAKRRTSD